MELSKLNISSIAKEEIRRRFFDSRSEKSKKNNPSVTSDEKSNKCIKSSEDETSPTLKQEVEQNVVTQQDEEVPASENDGFPLITSVFSLAQSSSETANETANGCVSSDALGTSKNVTNTAKPLSNDRLPFVVKCNPNGVITVSLPPNPTSPSHFRDKSVDSTCSLREPVCSVDSSDKISVCADEQMFPDTLAGSLLTVSLSRNTADQNIPIEAPASESDKCLLTDNAKTPNSNDFVCSKFTGKKEFESPEIAVSLSPAKSSLGIKETQLLPSSENSQMITKVETSSSELLSNVTVAATTDTISVTQANSNNAEEKLMNDVDPNSPRCTLSDDTASQGSAIQEEYVCPTRQEEKIRKLKDLLRQKEEELEKFRIKGRTVSMSAAEQLRANFLKKNPSLRRRSQRLNTNEGETSSCKQTDTVNRLACKKNVSSENEMNVDKVCKNATLDTSTKSFKQNSTKFTDEEKYKLVNVTILQGHTRTLAVPVHTENMTAASVVNDAHSKTRVGNNTAETTTRKRKQEFPRIVELSPSKRKAKCDEHTSSRKTNKAVSPNTGKFASPTGPTTRSSPRRRQGHHSMTMKRTYQRASMLKTQSGLSGQKKKPRIISTSEVKDDHPLASSQVSEKTGSAKPEEACPVKKAGTQNNNTFNQDSVIAEQTGKPIAHVVYLDELSGTTNPKTKSQTSTKCNEEIVKRVVESMSKEVLALVSKAQGDNTETTEDSMRNNATVSSPLRETKAKSKLFSSVSRSVITNCTSTTNNTGNPTERNSPEADKFAATSMRKLIVSSVKKLTTASPNTPDRNTVLSFCNNITSTNTSPKVSFPSKLAVINKEAIHSDTSLSNEDTSGPTQSSNSVHKNPKLSPDLKSRISTDEGNGQEDGCTRNISLEVKGESTVMKRKLAPKPVYTLAALSVPVPLANNASGGLSKIRPLVPKPVVPQLTSQRLLPSKLCSKPTSNSSGSTSPEKVAYVPVCHAATPQNISQPVGATRESIPCPYSTKLVTSKLESTSMATKSAASESLNQVISVLPRPVMTVPASSSSVFPENLNNGKILVYDVVQSNFNQDGRRPPLMSKDAAKLVVYLSNTGESRNLGIIKDKKIYLNSNQVATASSQPQPNSPLKMSTSEFIPNPEDTDFKVLVGLEHVVKLLTYD